MIRAWLWWRVSRPMRRDQLGLGIMYLGVCELMGSMQLVELGGLCIILAKCSSLRMGIRQVRGLTRYMIRFAALHVIFTRWYAAGRKTPTTSVKACSVTIAYPTAVLAESSVRPRTKQIIISVVASLTAGAIVLMDNQGWTWSHLIVRSKQSSLAASSDSCTGPSACSPPMMAPRMNVSVTRTVT
jgi:hypothetical protein